MEVIDDFNKIKSLLKVCQSKDSLKSNLYKRFTTRLWSDTLIERSSLEGEITCFIRHWTQIDNEKLRWKQFFHSFFANEQIHQIAQTELSVNERNTLYLLRPNKSSHSDFISALKTKLKEQESLKEADQSELNQPVHWTNDSQKLRQLSLLRTSEEPAVAIPFEASVLNEIYGQGVNRYLYKDSHFLGTFISYIKHYLAAHSKMDQGAVDNVNALLGQGYSYEAQIQQIITLGKEETNRADAEHQLNLLAQQIFQDIQRLKCEEKRLFFGGIPGTPPSLNLLDSSNEPFAVFLNQVFDPNISLKWTDQLFGVIQSEDLFSESSSQLVDHVRRVLKDGLVASVYPQLTQSLIKPEHHWIQKCFLSVPEFLRWGVEASLTSFEKHAYEEFSKRVLESVNEEFCMALKKAFSEGKAEHFLRKMIKEKLQVYLRSMQDQFMSSVIDLSSNLPSFAGELMKATGYGQLGDHGHSFWFEISRQDNGYEPYRLSLYISNSNGQEVVPLQSSSIVEKKLTSDFFLLLLHFRVLPEWNSKVQFDLKDLNYLMTDYLKVTLTEQGNQFQEQASKQSKGHWNLFESYLTSHLPFLTKEEQQLFYFNWKKEALISFCNQLLKSSDSKDVTKCSAACQAAQALAEDAINFFEGSLIDEDTLKAIYATTRDIQESFSSKKSIQGQPTKGSQQKSRLLPQEFLAIFQNFLRNAGNGFSLAQKLLVDVLGSDFEPVLEEVLENFKENQTVQPEPSQIELTLKNRAFRLAERSIQLILSATVGVNLKDITHPTSISYLKIALSVTRFAISCLFPHLAISLNVKWVITILAKEAFCEIGQAYFPERMQQIRSLQAQFDEWRLRLLAKGMAALFIDENKRAAFHSMIREWKNFILPSAPLSYDIGGHLKPQKSDFLSLKTFRPIVLVNKATSTTSTCSIEKEGEELKIKDWNVELGSWIDHVETHISLKWLIALNKWCANRQSVSADGVFKEEDFLFPLLRKDVSPLAVFCLEKLKQLPIPSNENSIWYEIKDPLDCLEKISLFALQVYNLGGNPDISLTMRYHLLILLYKCYAIIDVLARRLPEANLDGYEANPWALALIKQDAFFNVFDPKVRQDFDEICRYFGIDPDKNYTDEEIEAQKNVLFRDQGDSRGTFYNPSHSTRALWNSLGSLVNTISGSDGLKYKEPVSSAEKRYYEELLEASETKEKFEQRGLGRAPILKKIALVTADPDHIFLSRAFSLFRLAGNFLTNQFTVWVFRSSHSAHFIGIQDLNFSPIEFEIEDNSVRETLNELPLVGRYVKKMNDSALWDQMPGNYATVKRKGNYNAADRNIIASPKVGHTYSYHSGAVNLPFIRLFRKHLHTVPRTQNEVMNEPLSFEGPVAGNLYKELPVRERQTIESLWIDTQGQIVHVLSYFHLNLDRLANSTFCHLFTILLLRSDILEKYLKANPHFVKTLGAFFKKALKHFDEKGDLQTQLNILNAAIPALILARNLDPKASLVFPDISSTLKSLYDSIPASERKEGGFCSQIATLMVNMYQFIDPSTASQQEKEQACIDCCRSLIAQRSFSDLESSYKEAIVKWKDTIAQVLDENAVLREQLFGEIAIAEDLMKYEPKGWKGSFPTYCSGNISIRLFLEAGKIIQDSVYFNEISTAILNHLGNIYESCDAIKLVCVDANEYLYDENITIRLKILPEGNLSLKFFKSENRCQYRWVMPSQGMMIENLELRSNQTYWLEETESEIKQLLILENGSVVENCLLKQEKKGVFSRVLDIPKEVEVDLQRETHGLDTLTTFQPLHSIKAFVCTLEPSSLKRIEFSALNLSFSVEEVKGKKVAVGSGGLSGFYIASDQRQEKELPVLTNHARYLLLENAQGAKKVILSTDALKASILSWCLEKLCQFRTSAAMEIYMTPLIESLSSQIAVEEKSKSLYFAYSIDAKGRLSSDDPHALLYLILYSLAQGQLSEISYYLKCFEGIGKKQSYPKAIFPWIRKLEYLSMVIREPLFVRLSLRLVAIKEENELIQLQTEKSVTSNTENFISWFALQVNYIAHFHQQSQLPHIPLSEYHELFLLRSIVSKGKKFLEGFLSEKRNQNLNQSVRMIGLDTIATKLMMLPQISKRYTYLFKKYSLPGENPSAGLKAMAKDLLEGVMTHQVSQIQDNIPDSPLKTTKRASVSNQEEAIQMLISLVTVASKDSIMKLLPTYQFNHYKDFESGDRNKIDSIHRCFDAWKAVPLHFSQLSYVHLSQSFLSYYQLAIGTPPSDCTREEELKFKKRAKELRKSLKLARGNTSAEKTLIEVLRAVSYGSQLMFFPDPNQFRESIIALLGLYEDYVRLSSELKSTEGLGVEESTAKSEKLREVQCRFFERFGTIVEFVPTINTSYKSFTTMLSEGHRMFNLMKGMGKAHLKSTLPMFSLSSLMSTCGYALTPQVKLALSAASWSYKAYTTYRFLRQQQLEVATLHKAAIEDRKSLDAKNAMPEDTIPSNWREQFRQEDNFYFVFMRSLLGTHFNPPELSKGKEVDHAPTIRFKTTSEDAFLKKRFKTINRSLKDYAAREVEEVFPEELKSDKSYDQLKYELEKGRKYLSKQVGVQKARFLLRRKRKQETKTDQEVLADLIRNKTTRYSFDQTLTDDIQFDLILKAFINDDNSALMLFSCCEIEDLGELKKDLYLYLIAVTRLQQMNRVLGLLEKIAPNRLHDEETKVRLRQLSFEMGRPRAYTFDQLSEKILRGYLAFECGTNTLLWPRQVGQLQRMLLDPHNRLVAELATGSGKTFFGTPMISFHGTNRQQVIHNCFPDALFVENTKDLDARLQDVYDFKTNAMKISRQRRLTADNLWAMLKVHMRAVDLQEPLNSCKRDLQSLELLFIEEAYKSSKKRRYGDEQLLLYYMKLLDFIRTKEKGNIDEADRLFAHKDELNHPLGKKKGIKLAYVDVISECMRLLTAIPEVVNELKLQKNDQALCSEENYHAKVKPLIALRLISYFKIKEEDQKAFVAYLCDYSQEVPGFFATIPSFKQKAIDLARGVLNSILPDALGKQVKVHFGIDGNEHHYAQPYSSKDKPVKGSTFKNPYEAAVKTLMCYLFLELNFSQVSDLVKQMNLRAIEESTRKQISYADTRPAQLFQHWTKNRYRLNDQANFDWHEIARILNAGYGAKLTYARFFAIPYIFYYTKSVSSNSHNFGSMFAGYCGGTASPNNEDTLPTETKILWDKGTAGEFVSFVCRTCGEDSIVTIQSRKPMKSLNEILHKLFGKGSTKTALIDAGALFYGLSNQTVVQIILDFVQRERPDEIQAVVYHDEDNHLMIQEYAKEPRPFSNDIPLKRRLTYFDNSHIFGADITQAIKAGGVVTLSEKTDFEQIMQGGGRMRGLKNAQQWLTFVMSQAVKELISKSNASMNQVVSFTLKNEVNTQRINAFPSCQNQVSNHTRRFILDKMITSSVDEMLEYMRKFNSQLIKKTVVDPTMLYGGARANVDAKQKALPLLKEQQLAIITQSKMFTASDICDFREQLGEIGKDVTLPPTVPLLMKNGQLVFESDELGVAQEIQVTEETTQNQNMEVQQQLEVDQNLQVVYDLPKSDRLIRFKPAEWNKKVDYLASCDWLKNFNDSGKDHQNVEIISVCEALDTSSNSRFSGVKEAFQGLYWTNNFQGIVVENISTFNGIEVTAELAEPFSMHQKPINEILIIQRSDMDGGVLPIITCALDYNDVEFWRELLLKDQKNTQSKSTLKIAIYDIGINAIEICGRNEFDPEALRENVAFRLDVLKWKFLAAHVNLGLDDESFEVVEAVKQRFAKWIEIHGHEKMKACYDEIYTEHGFLPTKNSQMERFLVNVNSNLFEEFI